MAELVSGYSIIQKLGDGARSQVYQVVRPETGEVFALKRVFREPGEDTRYLDQAINEHEVSSRIAHPHLRRSIELRRVRRFLRLAEVQVVMEFVDGVSLDKARPERVERAIELFIKVAEGLHSMHAGGFIHADIKPNNILLTFDGGVRIIDFGQCCRIGFRKPRIQGTPDYIAPEQVDRQHLSAQTDVYNLGATLYWTLTGRTYPTIMSRQGTRREAVRASDVASPQDVNAQVPVAVGRLVMECCAHDRKGRPRDMKEVVGRLEIALQSLGRSVRGVDCAPSAESAADRPKGAL